MLESRVPKDRAEMLRATRWWRPAR